MSPRRLLLALVCVSAAGLTAIALLIHTEAAPGEVAAASPPRRTVPLVESTLDSAPSDSPRMLAHDAAHDLSCRGRVFGDFGDGAEGVPIEIGIEAADGTHVLAHAVSRAGGTFECDVHPPADLADREEARLFARIDHEGYPRRLIQKPVKKIDQGIVFRLSLALLHVLPGRVVDSGGAPVKGAVVELRTDGLPGIDASATTNADGEFEMLWRRPGAYRLSAKAVGRGSAEINPFTLAGEIDPDPISIELSSSDVLEGRIEDTEGRPIGGEELWTFPASLAGSPSEDLFRWRMSSNSTTADGVRSAFTVSTESGSFRFAGLAPGAYFIAPKTELDETTIAARVWRTGDRNASVIVERWWLELQHPHSTKGRLFCAGLYNGKAGRAIKPVQTRERTGSDVFPVEGGRTYLYGWIDENHAAVEDSVLIPWDHPRTVREITEGPEVASGGLQLSILTLDADDERRARCVSVRSSSTDFELWNWRQHGEDSAHALPPGQYLLRVTLEPTHSYRDGTPGFETLLVSERTIQIQSDSTIRLELRL